MSVMLRSKRAIRRVTLSEQLVQRLREDIWTGKLISNAQLNERELALTFGVSRGPLREAMQRLIQEGLLRSEPHRGVFVEEIDEADLKDIYFVRGAIETAAIKQIITFGNAVRISDQLLGISERMEKAVGAKRWKAGSELDFEFHRTLVDGANSKRLAKTYTTVQAETRLCLHRLMAGYRCSTDLAVEHFEFANILKNGDLTETIEELKKHFGDPVAIMHRAKQNISREKIESLSE